MRSVTKWLMACVFASNVLACADLTDEPDVNEPELTTEELGQLLDEATDEAEHAESALVEGPIDDDAALFDDDEVDPAVQLESDVLDDDEPGDGQRTVDPDSAKALLKWGLHPRASDALRSVGVSAGRIMQTIGNAPASAGYHKQDGTVNGKPYCSATDISTSGLSTAQIKNLLEKLGKAGFAAWYRKNGSDHWVGPNHIHAVYANSKMKASLRSQVRSWQVGRNGLIGNAIYKFHKFSAAAKRAVKAKFKQSKHGTTNDGSGVSGQVNTAGAPLTIRSGATSNSSAVGTVADGAWVTISCQREGQSVKGTYGTSKWWDKIGKGYVADAFIKTGSDGRVAPLCK